MLISVPKNLGRNNVPAGIYQVTLAATKRKVSKNGNPMICPEFTITTQGPDEGVKTMGRKLFDNWTITEAALGIVNNGYKALTGQDLPAGDFEIDEFMDVICENVSNRECLVDVILEDDGQGGERNKIHKYLKLA